MNRQAFLDMISKSEGTFGKGDNGYNVLVGGGLFTGYKDHPRRHIQVRLGLWSTAAGRYQLLEKYYDHYRSTLNLPDFSPHSQDMIALQQIRECKALPNIDSGNIHAAIEKTAHIWASLPGAGYDQHENKYSTLMADYVASGGKLA